MMIALTFTSSMVRVNRNSKRRTARFITASTGTMRIVRLRMSLSRREYAETDSPPEFQSMGRHRGAAFGDFDRDGLVDIVVSRIAEPAELFRNVSPGGNHWLALRLRGHRSNRQGIGALVHIVAA